MTVDAVIVGSGPGGATAAEVLTAAGWSVTIIEKGRNHLLDPDNLTQPSFDYSNDEIKFHSRHFLGPDPLIEPRTFRTEEADGDRVHVGEFNSVPTTVGGGGVHADGKVPRFRPDDFRLLSQFGPQPGADVDDWPVDYDELEPYYAEVERAIGVAGTEGSNPFAAPRSGPFPMPSGAPMFGAVRSTAAAEKLGYHPYPAPTRRQQRSLRLPAGLQQLRVLRLLRLSHPRQGRSHRHAAAHHGHGSGRAAVGDLRVPGAHRGPPGHRRGRDRAGRDRAVPGRPPRHRGRRCHRDTPAAPAVRASTIRSSAAT